MNGVLVDVEVDGELDFCPVFSEPSHRVDKAFEVDDQVPGRLVDEHSLHSLRLHLFL